MPSLPERIILAFGIFVAGFSPSEHQGLYPRVDVFNNYAIDRVVTASSTCGTPPTTFCRPSDPALTCSTKPLVCNSSCPHGSLRPTFQDVLSAGKVFGQVRFCSTTLAVRGRGKMQLQINSLESFYRCLRF